jgi:lipopolysaccharide/colanic/teichoic acid biosynthesis glycosyltransferase
MWIKSILDNKIQGSFSTNRYESALVFNRSLAKRMFDYLLTIPMLIFLFPLSLLIAALIKLDSRGPIFYSQERVGLNDELFMVHKFRTMVDNADESLHKNQIRSYAAGHLDAVQGVKLKEDPRITRLGKFLRLSSLDELPQLINVVKGEMSLVGPRPVPVYEADLYNLWQSERMSTLPGITGLWQVSGRSEVSFEEQLRMDIRYIRNQSIELNFMILFATIPVVFSRRGAG